MSGNNNDNYFNKYNNSTNNNNNNFNFNNNNFNNNGYNNNIGYHYTNKANKTIYDYTEHTMKQEKKNKHIENNI